VMAGHQVSRCLSSRHRYRSKSAATAFALKGNMVAR
jgi:hypothetical protein